MKTSHGKLAMLAFVLLMAVLLFAPMRAGQEDQLRLEPSALKMNVGDRFTVRCLLSSEDTNQRLRFVSSNDRVASIGRDGTVYALSSGEATITARASGGASAQMQVYVAGVPMTDLRLNVEEVYLEKGQYSGLRISYNADASDTRMQWISSDERVVRVDATGRILGVGGGEAYVSVLTPNGRSASAKVYVNVDGTAVHISPNRLTLGVGAKVPLKLSFLPLDSTDRVRRWVSSDTNVLEVDENGVISARHPGAAYITVLTEDGLTTGMEVIVEPAPQDIQLDPSRATLERGDTLQMQLQFLNGDGSVDANSRHLVVWSSDDESVATVDQNGLVTALRSGSCKIEASADGMTASCRLNVQVSVQEITLDKQEVYMLPADAGTPIQLLWVVAPVDADDPEVVFTSNNTQVATVDRSGLVSMTGGYGTAIITASAKSGAQAEFIVNVVTQLPQPEAEEAPLDDADMYGDDYPYTEEDMYGDTYPYTEEDMYGDTYPYTEEDMYGDTYPYTEEDMYGDTYPYTEEDMYGDTYPYTEEDMYGDTYPYTEEDMYGDDYPYTDEDIYGDEPQDAPAAGVQAVG